MTNKHYLSIISILFYACSSGEPDHSPFNTWSGGEEDTGSDSSESSSSSGSSGNDTTSADTGTDSGSTSDSSSETGNNTECSRSIIFLDQQAHPVDMELKLARYGVFIETTENWFGIDFNCSIEGCEVPCRAEQEPDLEPDTLLIVYECGMETYKHWNLNDQPTDPYVVILDGC